MTTKKITYSIALCLALLLGSCLSEPINSPYGEDNGVVIRFDRATRGTPGDAVQFNTGHLFFTSGFGTIVQYFEIHDDANRGTDVREGHRFIYVGDLQPNDRGVNIYAIPNTVQSIVVVGNTPLTSVPVIAGTTNIADIRARRIYATSQHTINNVNLWGESPPRNDWDNNNDRRYTVRVHLYPTVAHIELHTIQALYESEIYRFRVEAIFVDRHYYAARIGGARDRGDITVNNQTFPNFVERGQESALFAPGRRGYNEDGNYALFDIVEQYSNRRAPGTPAIVTNAGSWGYNLFAEPRVEDGGGNNATPMPHIVIRLSNIQLRDGSEMQGIWYVTVRGILHNYALLPGIRARHIYQLSEVLFTE